VILENDPRIVELLRWFLERRGHRVRAAANVEEARELLRERRPDLLLSDLDLGGENARDHLPELARSGALPPTLVVSGFLDNHLARELLAIPGVAGVMPKPFEFERLERWIEEFLARGVRAAPPVDAAAP
jgi:DNA-binding response OmpR family regulator